MFHEENKRVNFKDFILGGQDGLVNVLGLVLGVASATLNSHIVIISGIVATVAESVSMMAVAYTSSRAAKDYYGSMINEDRKHFNKLMLKEHRVLLKEFNNPIKGAFVVGFSTLVGSLIPLIPFFLFTIKISIVVSIIISALALFIVGAVKAKLSLGNWKRSGIELMIIGIIAAFAGYGIGLLLKAYGV